ncbi:YfgG family protein [Edwardsiella piscicida]|nr:YfgG family protein [Edwardsiella piscicida]UCQ42074.1 YfgG family protein [Edwardsiella piscicida]
MKRRTNMRMTRIVLLISFIILFGRLLYASIGALNHHRSQQNTSVEQSQPLTPSDADRRR